MPSYKCRDCYNDGIFVHTYRGLSCAECGSYDVVNVASVVRYPPTPDVPGLELNECEQMRELTRMYYLEAA